MGVYQKNSYYKKIKEAELSKLIENTKRYKYCFDE